MPEKTKKKPTALPAKERYAGGTYSKSVDNVHPIPKSIETVTSNIDGAGYFWHPAKIQLIITSPNIPAISDTTYVEHPAYSFPHLVEKRTMNSTLIRPSLEAYLRSGRGDINQFLDDYDSMANSWPYIDNREEYETLKRRFNEAKSVSKKQQGGNLNMNEQIMQFAQQILQAALGGLIPNDEQGLMLVQLALATLQGDLNAALQLTQIAQQMQLQQAQYAKLGAKLAYIKRLRGQCPEGMEARYFKAGGQLCIKCMQIQQETPNVPQDPIEAFRCGGKKVKKAQKGLETNKPTATNKTPFAVYDGKGGKKTTYVKDEATRDSLYVNRYNDQELQASDKGNYKGGKWVPDRKNVYTLKGNIPKGKK